MTPHVTADPETLARALVGVGISPSYASELARKKRTPSLKKAVLIEQRLGISPRWWIDREAA